jgi:hypothetical protein
MERPELVAATGAPNKARGPGAECSSYSLGQGTTGGSSSPECSEEASKACWGPRTRDSQALGRSGARDKGVRAPKS